MQVTSNRSNEVTVSTNVEGFKSISFNLTYEEYLPQMNDIHSQEFKIISDVIVNVTVQIYLILEPKDMKTIDVLRIIKDKEGLTKLTNLKENYIRGVKGYKAKLSFSFTPSALTWESQIQQKFGIQYSLNDKTSSETLFSNNYFVHFFPTKNVTAFPSRHIVFVIDISGSMYGLKLQQTKDATITLIDSLRDIDFFNIITFHGSVYYWPDSTVTTYSGTTEMKRKANAYIRNLQAGGWTNINDALLAGINVVKNIIRMYPNTKPMIFFMTDGEPTAGETRPDQIRNNVATKNKPKTPIHGLAFGDEADFYLVKSISDGNEGKSAK